MINPRNVEQTCLSGRVMCSSETLGVLPCHHWVLARRFLCHLMKHPVILFFLLCIQFDLEFYNRVNTVKGHIELIS